jgi:putative membrane protein
MSEQPLAPQDEVTFSTSGPHGFLTPRRVARIAILVALSGAGAFIKIPSPTGTVALDSAPGYLAAAVFSPLEGGIVGALGHLISAATAGLPLGLPVHLIVAAEMFLFAWVFGWLSRRVGLLAGGVAAALLNGLLAPAILIPVGGLGMYVAQVVPLLAGSAINIVVAAVAGVALAAAGLADHPVGITGPGRR